MRCECCNDELTDVDATAKFADGRFVGMCRECRKWLPPDVTVRLRKDLREPKVEEVNYDAPDLTEWEREQMGQEWDES